MLLVAMAVTQWSLLQYAPIPVEGLRNVHIVVYSMHKFAYHAYLFYIVSANRKMKRARPGNKTMDLLYLHVGS